MRPVRYAFNGIADIFSHFCGKLITEIMLEHIPDSALPGLRIDPYHFSFVISSYVFGINRQIRHVPDVCAVLFPPFDSFGDSILVRAGESGENKFAGIREPFVDIHARNRLVKRADARYITEFKLRIYAVSIQIQRKSNQVDIACPFTVSEKSALDPVCTGKQTEFGSRNGAPSVVVRMKRYVHAVPV